MTRAPKGGVTVQGIFYKGGQFLPSNEPQRGKFNSNSRKSNKARKVQVAPYKWEYAPEGMTSVWSKVASGVFTTLKDDKLVWCASAQTEAYYKVTDEFKAEIMAYANKWNDGEYWVSN